MNRDDPHFCVTDEDLDMARFAWETAQAAGVPAARVELLHGDLERLLGARAQQSEGSGRLYVPLYRPLVD
jgi:hypothetical protein